MRRTAPHIEIDQSVSRHDRGTDFDQVYIQTQVSREQLLALHHQIGRALCGETGLVCVIEIPQMPAYGFDWKTEIQMFQMSPCT